ncbi:MAG: ComF family protein [Paramuribaculum sp.]|nr:ComF family protein [Paramuribaculum sp.]
MGFTQRLGTIASHVVSVIFPRLCEVCGTALTDGEEIMCLDCLYSMPVCNLDSEGFNIIHQRLASHTPVNRAAGLFHYYRGNPYTRLIHAAKYNNRPQIARYLGTLFARRLLGNGFFENVDVIVPVPLHKTRQRRRGYNQSQHIAAGISDVTAIPVKPLLMVTRPHSTQTRRDLYHRWLNSLDTYTASPRQNSYSPKHILLVDDVITTGSTMLACLEALHTAYPSAHLSVLTLGVAQLR